MILGSVSAEQDPEWKLVQHAQYGILNRSGKFLEPAGATPCELSEDAKDPTALVYSMPLLANYYDVLTAEAYDESTPPDVDIAAAQDDDAISGFTSDTPLLPLAAVRSLKEARTMPVKAEQLSASELQEIIQEYIERDVLNYTSHEDVLAAIQVQPSYFRRIFWLPDDCQRQMFLSHAVYRAVCAEPTAAGESTDFLSRLRARYGDDAAANPAGLFDRMFKEESRRAALNCAISDLFLMIFSPGIYVDPVKVDVLLPMTMPPKRLRNTPFLLWGDVNLLCLARTDVTKVFLDDTRTPAHVYDALSHLSSTDLPPAVETAPSRLLVAFQEMKFTEEDSMQTNTNYIHVADSGARCFWSNTTPSIFNGRHGAGLVLSSASPFGDVEDITAKVYKTQLQNRYLLLKTSLAGRKTFLHVVYAPDDPPLRGEYFRSLPTDFNDDENEDDDGGIIHLIVGDFNVAMNNFLDQATPSNPHPGRGREDLNNWLDALGVLDAWRFMNPKERDFTGPKRQNRLDYCFMTGDLLQDHLESIRHVRDRKWHKEDHIPVEFRLQAKFLPRLKKDTWRCPTWLLRDAQVKEHLEASATALTERIKIFPGANPGCLLDEHKRTDCIYLRKRWKELRNADTRAMAEKVTAVNDAHDTFNVRPTQENKDALEQKKLILDAYRESIKERNQYKKFAADLHLT
ncbi:hypothetical protein BBI17_009493 [Phytophthora kernoviae]|uniref:Endonuclease/exonuclease/phosphatase domain-containing protein n=1 Tax=Phytophthora kernoviae TaxID=325452 RepID=A0A421ETL7_9STRA|nr:hypothetical protein BBI17_009493 [Phytophthora kernoviae]